MKSRGTRRIFLLILLATSVSLASNAFSLSLDSIAAMGRFPRFCIDTYRWGDRFFNGYDTAYVVGNGYKFNVKVQSNNWLDFYNFELPNNIRMSMMSEPSTSVGARLSYLAVSMGYEKNISKFFGNLDRARERLGFSFNCSLFAFDIYWMTNNVQTRIMQFGPRGNATDPDLKFDGITTKSHGWDLYYFFNHKKYSQAAAFSFSRIQTKSQGSMFAGLSYSDQDFKFDFGSLPEYMKDALPSSWTDYLYTAHTKNYAFKLGYGYNWVFKPGWLLAVSESPTIGLKKGYIANPNKESLSFALSNRLRLSLVWNRKRWFAAAMGDLDIGLIYDKEHTFTNGMTTGSLLVGYRFNLW